MTVQGPSGEFGPWPKAKAWSDWPDSAEDVVGRSGGPAAEQFSLAAAFDLSKVAGEWRDGAGRVLVT
jgi:hypothetical protein